MWLAKDLKYNTYVAIKIQRSASQYLEAAFDEVEILDQCSSYWMKPEWLNSLKDYYSSNPEKLSNITGDDCYCVQLLNCFLHHGPHGKHFVTVFEILSCNLLEVIKRYNYKGAPIPIVRQMAKQCLIGLDYLHRVCKVIHTDLKPENVNLCLTPEELNEIHTKGMLKQSKMNEDQRKQNEKLRDNIELKKVEDETGRGRGNQQENESIKLDKQAKRALKRKQAKARKRAAKRAQESGFHHQNQEQTPEKMIPEEMQSPDMKEAKAGKVSKELKLMP